MPTISQLSSTDTLAAGDLFAIWDQSAGGTRKLATSVLTTYIENNLDLILAGITNIQDNGAVGDGTTNDATALVTTLLSGDIAYIPETANGYVFEPTEAQVDTILDNLQKIMTYFPIVITLPAMDHTRGTIEQGSPWSYNIRVTGSAMTSQTVTAVTIDSQAAADHRVTFTVSDSSAFVLGGFAFVKNLVGTNRPETLEGIWEVTSVSAGAVQLKIKAQRATLPAITATSGTITSAATIIRVNGAIGIDIVDNHGGRFDNFALVGNNSGVGDIAGVRVRHGQVTLAASTALPFGAANFLEHGIYALQHAFIECFDSYASGNGSNGYYALDGSTMAGTRIIGTGNGADGIVSSSNSSIAASQSNASGNDTRGIFCSGDAYIIANSAVVYENNGIGARSGEGAFIDLDGGFVAGNASNGVRADNAKISGTIDFTGGNDFADNSIENNGWINEIGQLLIESPDGTTGQTASNFANDLVIDNGDSTGAGISILTLEAEYGAIYFGNPADADEASIRYRGTSNALDFYTQSAKKWSISSLDHWLPAGDDAQDIGSTSFRINQVYTGQLVLIDGITAPSTIAGHAAMYVDTADGDLKIRFSDGTIKTIVTDT